VTGDFFITFHVRQEQLLFFHNMGRKVNEAAIGIDLHGLGDFLEGLV
jgi:hypothetical protein